MVGLVVAGFAMVSGGGYECGGWVCALQWLVVVGLCLHFQMFRIHQTLPNTWKWKYFTVKYLHVKYFTFENILLRNKRSVKHHPIGLYSSPLSKPKAIDFNI